jgi:hypothetical protein
MIRRPFQPQFEPLILAGTKIHTIRPTPKRLPQIGEVFIGYVWTGKPYRSPQREFFKSSVTRVSHLTINPQGQLDIDGHNMWTYSVRRAIAVCDGFSNFEALLDWFRANHDLPFTGIIIEWATPVNRLLSPESCLLSPPFLTPPPAPSPRPAASRPPSHKSASSPDSHDP